MPPRCCRRRRTSASGPRSGPEPLAQRQHVGQRLARVLFVGQGVDHMHARGGGGEARQARPARTSARRRRRPSVRGCAPRLRRSRGRRSTTSGGGSMTSPPSSRTAMTNVIRVRSDGFSKRRATCRPASGCAAGAARGARPLQRPPPGASSVIEFGRRQVEHRQEVLRTAEPPDGLQPVSRSRSVLRVDAHVFGAEIAGPHRGVRGARPCRGRR